MILVRFSFVIRTFLKHCKALRTERCYINITITGFIIIIIIIIIIISQILLR